MAKLDQLLTLLKEKKGSDLHISSGCPPFIRINGDMCSLAYRDLTPIECQALIFEILTEKQKSRFKADWELDSSYKIDNVGVFRLNIFMQRRGIAAVFRYIPSEILTCKKLGLPQPIVDLTKNENGLVLVTGPTGSGKSTTLAAMIDHINRNYNLHIITIEDPIEFVHENKHSLINQREVHTHSKSFSSALRVMLREDPDVILVGEMRDLETIQMAITAAETGHLVFGTLHTSSAAQSVDRLVDIFPEEKQKQVRLMVSESLRGIVAQTLIKRQDKDGRVGVFEVLINTPAVGNLIREGKASQIVSVMQTSQKQGMITFDQAISKLKEKGIISGQAA